MYPFKGIENKVFCHLTLKMEKHATLALNKILMSDNVHPRQEQPNNPLHGVKLKDMLEWLVENYGWDQMASKVHINCFNNNPTVKSSLKFLRRTPWARDKVEQLYLNLQK